MADPIKVIGETGKNAKALLDFLNKEAFYFGPSEPLLNAFRRQGLLGGEGDIPGVMDDFARVFSPDKNITHRTNKANALVPARWWEYLEDSGSISMALGPYFIEPVLRLGSAIENRYKTIRDRDRYEEPARIEARYQKLRKKLLDDVDKRFLGAYENRVEQNVEEELEMGLRSGIMNIDIGGNLNINAIPPEVTRNDGNFESNYSFWDNVVRNYYDESQERLKDNLKQEYQNFDKVFDEYKDRTNYIINHLEDDITKTSLRGYIRTYNAMENEKQWADERVERAIVSLTNQNNSTE